MRRKKGIGQRKKFSTVRTVEEEVEEEETVIITSMEQLEELDHEEFGFETRDEMIEYVAI